ncbi:MULTISPECIES: hypothetical protein [Gordonia]|uniref:hypothetical protein n=1 Tax=Gordonia TaxID=2053 RepID=UPI0019623B12|nr:hypothetical protein [Gordonia sp. BP-94]MBN0972354.1 hypothetical protein [Gordonia sp. BP-119]MBN0982460.1 hypothetical protein [Gordonia sp. BP-94]
MAWNTRVGSSAMRLSTYNHHSESKMRYSRVATPFSANRSGRSVRGDHARDPSIRAVPDSTVGYPRIFDVAAVQVSRLDGT